MEMTRPGPHVTITRLSSTPCLIAFSTTFRIASAICSRSPSNGVGTVGNQREPAPTRFSQRPQSRNHALRDVGKIDRFDVDRTVRTLRTGCRHQARQRSPHLGDIALENARARVRILFSSRRTTANRDLKSCETRATRSSRPSGFGLPASRRLTALATCAARRRRRAILGAAKPLELTDARGRRGQPALARARRQREQARSAQVWG